MVNRFSRLFPLFLVTVLVPSPAGAQGSAAPVELSLKRSIDIALAPEGSVRIRLIEEARRQAEARSAEARSALLPNLSGSVGDQNTVRNIAALGIRFQSPFPQFQIPETVGPYDVFDARASVTQSIFNVSSIRRFQASRAGVRAARAESDATRDEVAHRVASFYLAALRAEARVEAVRADVSLAESLQRLAINQQAAGTGTGIEVTRAEVQLANERQRLLVAQNEERQAHLQLLKAMEMRLDTPVVLTGKLDYIPQKPLTVETALGKALQTRADLKAQQQREESARLNYSGAKFERLPSVLGAADYGSIGSHITSALPTRTFSVSLRVPVFDGGRMEARRSEARSQYEQERLRSADLQKQIELEIRLSLDSLRSSEEQVNVAAAGLTQVQSELEQAQRRYRAGVANSIEVVDAQTRLARARENHILALYLYNQARIDLGRAIGTIRQMIY